MRVHSHVNTPCDQHGAPFACPDALIDFTATFQEYGLIIHDGGTSTVTIEFSPWCGRRLPESQWDGWFDRTRTPWDRSVGGRSPCRVPGRPPAGFTSSGMTEQSTSSHFRYTPGAVSGNVRAVGRDARRLMSAVGTRLPGLPSVRPPRRCASHVALLAAAVGGPGKRFDPLAESWHSGAP
ncbi:DUF6980 family protein [Streptomyces albospinus]|uniref:DUF6980 family protein n=1 Tax=Streptomyces albospinus TaxID=285515 RepID=UPI0035712BDF